ncbi:MAG: DUF2238 domain-containing protein [Bacteroidales bacterium]|nr:DUF2238 domain-containing protein [Bacteroidales bacterium]
MIKQSNAIKSTIFISVILFGIFTCIHPIYPRDMFLQHIGTVLLLSILAIDLKHKKLSLLAFSGVTLYIVLHIIGARYIYSYVPYNEWSQHILGININDILGIRRNGYDRFVHFSFGILFFPYLMHLFGKWQLSKTKTIIVSWLFIQTFSMIYELFEWLLTVVLSGPLAQNYNGQQGDIWDPQKDMALALIGSLLMVTWYLVRRRK